MCECFSAGLLMVTAFAAQARTVNQTQKRGAEFIANEHATNNGCAVPANIPVWTSGSPVCYDLQGCKPGYPVKAGAFNGGHGLMSGASAALWQFITQFQP